MATQAFEAKSADAEVAFYAQSGGRLADWLTLLHVPYTLWHLAYVVIGAAIAPQLDFARLLLTLGAFFLAVGIAAHAVDELSGRPLKTGISDAALWAVGIASLLGASALCVWGVVRASVWIMPLLLVGIVLVVSYNFELFGGRLHTDRSFAVAWGAYPVLVGGFIQTETIRLSYVVAAVAAYFLSRAQRELSLRARLLRRSAARFEGEVGMQDGAVQPVTREWLLGPIEKALRTLAWFAPTLAAALVVAQRVDQ